MQTNLTLLNLVILAAIIIGAFLGLSLMVVRRGNRKANRILGLLLVIISGLLSLAFYYNRAQVAMDCPHLFSAATPIPLLFGPLLYFYVKARLHEQFEFKLGNLIHLVPFALLLGIQLSYLLVPTGPQVSLTNTFARDAFWITNRTVALNIFKILFNLGYVLASLTLIRDWYEETEKELTDKGLLHLKWLRKLSWSVGFYWIGFSFVFIYQVLINTNMTMVDNMLSISLALVTLGIGSIALQKPDIYTEFKLKVINKNKYKKSSLDDHHLARIREKLLRAMEEHRLYLNHELTLRDLSRSIDIPPHYISQTLSRHMHTSFFDFINHYRVEHAKKMLADPKHSHLTILAIAGESGFNSKASFNRAFKKFAGTTPSRYQKNHLNPKSATH